MAKNAKLLELGPANIYLYIKPRASLLMTSTPANSHVYFEAALGGVDGNSITVAFVVSGNNTPLSVSVAGTAITVNLATSGGGLATSVANDVIAAITNDPTAAFLVVAAKKATEDGTGICDAQAATALTGGSDTGVKTDVGFLGEAVAYQVTTEVANLTGAQTGNVAQDKVVIGGMVKVVIPFKEISLDNLRIGVPSARLTQNNDKTKRRVDFHVAVGASIRSLSMKMTINKIKGGFESALSKDIIVIPEIGPAEGEVNFPFAPVTQREIMTNWYAWPDSVTNRWAFFGDELP